MGADSDLVASAFFALALCSFFSLSFACIACSFNCSISSSSSSSSSSPRSISTWPRWELPDRAASAGVSRPLFVGDGEGDARSAMRRNRSRPLGVLRRTSWGDFGGHWASVSAPDPAGILNYASASHPSCLPGTKSVPLHLLRNLQGSDTISCSRCISITRRFVYLRCQFSSLIKAMLSVRLNNICS